MYNFSLMVYDTVIATGQLALFCPFKILLLVIVSFL
jgi:hypothetical protein